MRSLAHAIWSMPFTLFGMGLGPPIVGWLSQDWSGAYGSNSLRYALVLISLLLPVGALGYLAAARTLRADLARAAQETPPR